MLSFDNTEVAFSSKNDKDLKRAFLLFRMVEDPALVKLGKYLTPLAFQLKLPVKPIIKATIFRQFCGGENIEECKQAIEELSKFNIGTILDYSVEGKHEERDLDATADEIIQTALIASGNKAVPFCVFKVTGVARFGLLEKVSANEELTTHEKEEYQRVSNRVLKICKAAFEANTPIFIDAEETWIQPAIDNLTHAMMAMFNKEKAIVYNTFQIYRHDRLAFLKESHQHAKTNGYHYGVKLVRGAYMEKERNRAEEMNYESPIQPNKAATDRDYDSALAYCVENISTMALCAGSHNENSALLLVDLMSRNNIPNNDRRIFFAQLLGMSDHISYNLSNAGYNVAKYVPYGPVNEVLPYLIRRAEENTSVKGQTGRELSLIIKELKRRKKK